MIDIFQHPADCIHSHMITSAHLFFCIPQPLVYCIERSVADGHLCAWGKAETYFAYWSQARRAFCLLIPIELGKLTVDQRKTYLQQLKSYRKMAIMKGNFLIRYKESCALLKVIPCDSDEHTILRMSWRHALLQINKSVIKQVLV